MVMSIINKVMGVVKFLVPSVECVHFWTDSPSSQYRNKSIFHLISTFPNLYGTLASWHFFECGHGTDRCDGIVDTTKRNADSAVKQGKAMIQVATDFYAGLHKMNMASGMA
ncbi:hypothetical protein DPMN_077622 [Dreissena polymorpha]|uniref:Uncharacterized protein n=1 Tax=Dreissena polymorpha TaxID=45954 RepID=A0A9D3YR02_DREPO|nr:hypothetical protein DPMN_077622 [Dreissena polymorpha]